ncbi:ScyD/ScyE family protein [Isoptericola hypogeus]|uniref:ScyD/ScyE family protein n=1 Tax=Isoptericola hypogeus TaxID=300179 RepID=A0ABN2JB73_9MICO
MRRVTTVVAAAATALLLATPSAVAHGGKHHQPRPPEVTDLATGLDTPLSVAAGPHGTTYVTQNFTGTITAVDRRGNTSTVHGTQPHEIFGPAEAGALSVHGRTLTFAETAISGTEEAPVFSTPIKTLRLDGHGRPVGTARTVTDLSVYEAERNPDGDVTYGFRETDQECLDLMPEDGMPILYTGIVESHPYATTHAWGTTFVADAAMNAIVSVSDRGRVRAVAVLPPQPTDITAEAAASNGLPDCAVGETYWFEPVPTDVEVGPWGQLYVTTLPGGPEDPSLGARGAVYRVNPLTGSVREVADGFFAATGLAVSPWGDIYVAELFGGRISKVTHGEPRTLLEVGLPAAVEWHDGDLLATIEIADLAAPPDEPPPAVGRLVEIDLPKGHGHWHGR